MRMIPCIIVILAGIAIAAGVARCGVELAGTINQAAENRLAEMDTTEDPDRDGNR